MARRRRPVPVSTPAPAGAFPPTLDVVVKPGWDGPAAGLLPEGARVLPVAPALPKSVDTPEADYLRRCYQVVLPAGASVADALGRLRTAEGVERVSAGPQIELPR